MKTNLNQEILDAEGKSIVSGPRPQLFLRDVCINAVLTPVQTDKPEDKWKKYEIFKKLQSKSNEIDLPIEDIALIKRCVGLINPPLIMGQAFEMLEGAAASLKVKK